MGNSYEVLSALRARFPLLSSNEGRYVLALVGLEDEKFLLRGGSAQCEEPAHLIRALIAQNLLGSWAKNTLEEANAQAKLNNARGCREFDERRALMTPEEWQQFVSEAKGAAAQVEAEEAHGSSKSLPRGWSIDANGYTCNQFGRRV